MSKNQALAVMTPEIREAFPMEVLDVIRTSLCPTATDPEFLLFAHKAASYKLDPFKNEIFFIKYGNAARIQFAAEAYLSKAREKEGFQPPDTQMVCENDEFRMVKSSDTKEMEVSIHEIGFPRGKIIGAYSIAYRDNKRPVTVIMDRSEVEHMFTGQNKDNWNKWTTDMFGKHVEQRALKKQYGLEFGDDETSQPVDAPDSFVRKDITEEAGNYSTPPKAENPQEPSTQPKNESEVDNLWKVVGAKLDELGHASKTAKAKYLQDNLKIKGENAAADELKKLIQFIEMEIAEKAAGSDELE
ncbi:RecT family protein [Paenibacillus algorifonticola]|uniref:RecT family protein n=1 Tax=Paenibacillus algorifonticola TaxID=684063 RepID=A0A1I2AF85_9BACL|nr:RecT family recombinase [Paenibacillus algorifonticola]SFE42665.1 RecT family protein [Paenibacillus algorifonticola]